jgi:hypothetical protein
MIYNTLHRKLKIESREPHWKSGKNSGAPQMWAVSSARVITDVFLLLLKLT